MFVLGNHLTLPLKSNTLKQTTDTTAKDASADKEISFVNIFKQIKANNLQDVVVAMEGEKVEPTSLLEKDLFIETATLDENSLLLNEIQVPKDNEEIEVHLIKQFSFRAVTFKGTDEKASKEEEGEKKLNVISSESEITKEEKMISELKNHDEKISLKEKEGFGQNISFEELKGESSKEEAAKKSIDTPDLDNSKKKESIDSKEEIFDFKEGTYIVTQTNENPSKKKEVSEVEKAFVVLNQDDLNEANKKGKVFTRGEEEESYFRLEEETSKIKIKEKNIEPKLEKETLVKEEGFKKVFEEGKEVSYKKVLEKEMNNLSKDIKETDKLVNEKLVSTKEIEKEIFEPTLIQKQTTEMTFKTSEVTKTENVNLNVVVEKEDVLSQIAEKFEFSDDNDQQKIVVKLKPDVLGELEIELKKTNNAYQVRFNVAKEEVRVYLERHVEELTKQLSDKGFDLDGFDFNSFKNQDQSFFEQFANRNRQNRFMNLTNGEDLVLDEMETINKGSISKTGIDIYA